MRSFTTANLTGRRTDRQLMSPSRGVAGGRLNAHFESGRCAAAGILRKGIDAGRFAEKEETPDGNQTQRPFPIESSLIMLVLLQQKGGL